MTYKAQPITESVAYFDVSGSNTVPSMTTLRYALFNLLKNTAVELMPTKLRAYSESINRLQDFWTEAQIQDFMSMFLFTSERLKALIDDTEQHPYLFSCLESWLGAENKVKEAESYGICRVIEETENKITRVVNAAYTAKNVYDSFMADFADLSSKNTIETAKKMVEQIADAQVQKVMSKIENVSQLIKNIPDITKNNVVRAKLLKARDELENMVSEDNVQKLKDMVSGQLGLTVSQFENIGPKEIRHLMDRACAISKNISLPFDRKSAKIDNIAQFYSGQSKANMYATSAVTQGAINSGAYRYNTSTIATNRSTIQRQEKQAIEAQPNSTYTPEPTAEEVEGVTKWNGGAGDSRITFNGPWVTKVGPEGWARVDPDAKVRLMRLQSLFGKQLIINSAYRPPAYNASVGGAPGSCHIKGYALDVKWVGFNASSKAQFIALAKQCGFGGIGRNYPTFVHIDIGPNRSW